MQETNPNFRRPIFREIKNGDPNSRQGSNSSKRRWSKDNKKNLKIKRLEQELDRKRLELDNKQKESNERKKELENKRLEMKIIHDKLSHGKDNYTSTTSLTNILFGGQEYPHIERWIAIIILILNILFPGLGTMILGWRSDKFFNYFSLGFAQALLKVIIGIFLLYAFNTKSDDSFLGIFLSCIWPMYTSFELLRLSY